ncbi:MAG: hypothetical protein AAGK78_11430, partial [Planctomycetota bacterium]
GPGDDGEQVLRLFGGGATTFTNTGTLIATGQAEAEIEAVSSTAVIEHSGGLTVESGSELSSSNNTFVFSGTADLDGDFVLTNTATLVYDGGSHVTGPDGVFGVLGDLELRSASAAGEVLYSNSGGFLLAHDAANLTLRVGGDLSFNSNILNLSDGLVIRGPIVMAEDTQANPPTRLDLLAGRSATVGASGSITVEAGTNAEVRVQGTTAGFTNDGLIRVGTNASMEIDRSGQTEGIEHNGSLEIADGGEFVFFAGEVLFTGTAQLAPSATLRAEIANLTYDGGTHNGVFTVRNSTVDLVDAAGPVVVDVPQSLDIGDVLDSDFTVVARGGTIEFLPGSRNLGTVSFLPTTSILLRTPTDGWVSEGTLNFGGTGQVRLDLPGSVPGVVFDSVGEMTLADGVELTSSNGTFKNSGTATKLGAGSVRIAARFDNDGDVEITDGTLEFVNGRVD